MGAPGERRNDRTPEAVFEELLSRAVAEGLLLSDAHADTYRALAMSDPGTARAVVAGLFETRRAERAPWTTSDGVGPDDESFEKDRRAQAWIAENAPGHEPTVEVYMRALRAVEAEDARSRLKAIERERRELRDDQHAEDEEAACWRVIASAR